MSWCHLCRSEHHFDGKCLKQKGNQKMKTTKTTKVTWVKATPTGSIKTTKAELLTTRKGAVKLRSLGGGRPYWVSKEQVISTR